ncbi:MAG: GDSL-type esterase/lipase family protein [Phycisphaerae bacterium]
MSTRMTRFGAAVVMCLVVGAHRGPGWAAETQPATAATQPVNPESAPIPAGKPWEAKWGQWPKFLGDWMKTHQGMVAQAKKQPDTQVVFFGDSLTKGWASAKAWGPLNAGWKALNFGIGGDGTSQVLYRIQNGELEPLNPKVIVLCIGTNNLYGDANGGTDEEIAQGVEAIVKAIQVMKPEVKILLTGIMPRQNEYFSGRVLKINEKLKVIGAGKNVAYVDCSDQFQESLGKMKAELYNKDLVHLTAGGYDLWATQLRPVLEKLMK